MNILFVCENYIPHYGGVEVVFKNLAEGLVRRGHAVTLVTHQMHGTLREEVIGGVRVVRVPSFHSRYLFTFLSTPTVLKLAKKADIIHTTTFNGAPPAWFAGLIRNKPVVLTVHEIWRGKWKQVTGFSWLKSSAHELLERAIYILPFSKYVCVSNATQKDLLNAKKIKEQRTKTIYNGLDYTFWDQRRFEENKAAQVRKNLLGKEEHQEQLLFSWGRPGPSKGFDVLINAMKGVVKSHQRAKLVLMLGSANKYQKEYQNLKNLIQQHDLAKNIQIIPSAPYEDLGHYINAADCIVVPSRAEGFGYTTTEAVAMGKPVIVSNAGSLPEVVSGKYRMFQSGNAQDLAVQINQGIQGEWFEKKIKRFEWKENIEAYEAEYKELTQP